jgi:hypothetical protein
LHNKSSLHKQADLEKPGAFDKNNPAAFGRFIERLSRFNYIDWQTIDLNSLEYVSFSSYGV